jgi:hypothetical protein
MAKIYSKLGKKSYKETRMIQSLENVLKAKFDADPQFQSNFVPAQNFDELKKMYETYCSEDVNFIEQTGTVESGETAIPAAETSGEAVEKERFIDPLNREAPKVRKYVMEDEFSNTENLADQNAQTKSTFDEPQTFEDSFSMPDDNTPKSEGKQKEQKQTRQDQPKAKQEPLNPEFDSMSAGKKKTINEKIREIHCRSCLYACREGIRLVREQRHLRRKTCRIRIVRRSRT